jgi:hypothetical protein
MEMERNKEPCHLMCRGIPTNNCDVGSIHIGKRCCGGCSLETKVPEVLIRLFASLLPWPLTMESTRCTEKEKIKQKIVVHAICNYHMKTRQLSNDLHSLNLPCGCRKIRIPVHDG